MNDTLAILLAGGAGERLFPLTRRNAKAAVPFGGSYRLIDFTLSNCINSSLRRILVLTQYKSLDLTRHLRDGWNILSGEVGEFIEVLPPMKRVHEAWYLGTADAVYQNIETIEAEAPRETLILAADHIYKMDYREMLAWHREKKAGVTVATLQAPPAEAARFGVAEIGDGHRIVGFEEKPQHGNPARSAFNRDMCSISMGVYLFDTRVLLDALVADAADTHSTHDFGRDVIPRLAREGHTVAFDFRDLNDKGSRYWRDVGTLDAYYEANMDLVAVTPELNLYSRNWPVRTRPIQQPPAKFVFAQEGRRMGVAVDSIVSPGCIISGGRVVRCVLSPGVRVNSYCEVEDSILLTNSRIGRFSRVRRAIIDEGTVVPESSVIGYDPAVDRASGYHVTETGIVVVSSQARALGA